MGIINACRALETSSSLVCSAWCVHIAVSMLDSQLSNMGSNPIHTTMAGQQRENTSLARSLHPARIPDRRLAQVGRGNLPGRNAGYTQVRDAKRLSLYPGKDINKKGQFDDRRRNQ